MRVIQPAMLERMARIALELPGHVVSVDSSEEAGEDDHLAPPDSGPKSGVVLRIDGVVAGELIDRLSG